MTRQSLRDELQHSILPPNHPLSRHVRRVVARIFHASNLGTLREEAQPSLSFGVRSSSEGDAWNPDGDFGAATDPGPSYGPSKEWDVIVVNNPKVINAMATPGRYTSNISQNKILIITIRYNHCIYWHSTRLSRRRRVGCRSFSWYRHPKIFLSLITDFTYRNWTCRWVGVPLPLRSLWTVRIFQLLGTPQSDYPPKRFHSVCFSFLQHLVSTWTWHRLYKHIVWIFQTRVLRREKVNNVFCFHHQFQDSCSPADLIGLGLISRACYNPDAVPA